MDLAARPAPDDLADVHAPLPPPAPVAPVASLVRTRPPVDPGVARASGVAVLAEVPAAPVTPAALRITGGPSAHWPEAAPAGTGPVPAAVAPGAGRPLAPEEPTPRTLRLLRGDARDEVLAGHRPVAWHYVTHVLGLPDDEPTRDLVERALTRAVGTYRGWRRLRRRPTGLGARLCEAVRVEAWRHQRERSRRRT